MAAFDNLRVLEGELPSQLRELSELTRHFTEREFRPDPLVGRSSRLRETLENGELTAHHRAAAREATFYRAAGDVQRLGDLVDREPIEIEQLQHRAKRGGHVGERDGKVLMLLLCGEKLTGALLGPGDQAARLVASTRFRTKAHEELIARNAEKEGLEARSTFEVTDRLEACEQRPLHDIVDILPGSAAKKSVDRRLVVPKELASCGLIARAPFLE
jgi:hypothetical protein